MAARNWIDRAIGYVAPGVGAKRVAARIRTETMVRAYDGAKQGRRTDGWRTAPTSADAEIGAALPRLRQRCRDLSRNNPHAKRAKSLWTTYLVGAGIQPRFSDKSVMDLWNRFVAQSDVAGLLDFHGQVAQAVAGMIDGGEMLLRRRLRRPEDGLAVPMQIEVLEGDHLDISKTQDLGNGRRIIQGVEFDAIGRVTAYWLFPEHPGNYGLPIRASLESRPVPASEIIHLYRHDGRTQTRGVPWAHAVVTKFRDWDDVEDAEIVRRKAQACLAAVAIGQTPEESDPENYVAPTVTHMDGTVVETFEPGMLVRMEHGKDIKFLEPGDSGDIAVIRKVSLHTIAAGYNVPYCLLSGDLNDVNFSSSKVGLVPFYMEVEQLQWLLLIPRLHQRVLGWFAEAADLVGRVDRRRVEATEWQPPGIPSITPLDDVNADIAEVRAGFASVPQMIAKRGYDPKLVEAETKAWNERADKDGRVHDTDPRRVARAGTEQPSLAQQEALAAPPAKAAPKLKPVA